MAIYREIEERRNGLTKDVIMKLKIDEDFTLKIKFDIITSKVTRFIHISYLYYF